MTKLFDIAKTGDDARLAKLFDFWLKDRYGNKYPYRTLRNVAITDDVVYKDHVAQELWTGWRNACYLFDATVDSILALPDEPPEGMCNRHKRPRPCPECSGGRAPG